jgi:predicted transcriptional regulator
MKKKVRTKSQEERDKRMISRLYLQGKIQAEIAAELKISQPTVSRELKELVNEWKIERVYDINEAKQKELAKIDNLELEYWEAWSRSRRDAERKIKKDAISSKGFSNETTEQVEPQVGDPRFLNGVQWCIERRCLILGVDAPKKIQGEIGVISVREVVVEMTGTDSFDAKN